MTTPGKSCYDFQNLALKKSINRPVLETKRIDQNQV